MYSTRQCVDLETELLQLSVKFSRSYVKNVNTMAMTEPARFITTSMK